MGSPNYSRSYLDNTKLGYNFDTWAQEYESAKTKGLYSLSTTLLVSGEYVPTYKPMGLLIDSTLSEIEHVCENDSNSSGSKEFGDFNASNSTLPSINELAKSVILNKPKHTNEVNISINEKAIIGLFYNKAINNSQYLATTILAQQHYKLQADITLPIFEYDATNGQLTELILTEEKRNEILSKTLRQDPNNICIFYYTENDQDKQSVISINGNEKQM